MSAGHSVLMPYPTLAELRTLEPELKVLDYTDDALTPQLAAAIEDVEILCGQSFGTVAAKTVTIIPDRRGVLRMPKFLNGAYTVVSCSVLVPFTTAVAIAPVDLYVDRQQRLQRRSGAWSHDQEVTITFSCVGETPARITEVVARVAKLYAQRARTGGIPDRVDRFALGDSGQPFMLAVPGVWRLGMPDIDAILGRWSVRHGLTSGAY